MNTIKKSIQLSSGIYHLTFDAVKGLFTGPFYPRLLLQQIYDIGHLSYSIIFTTGVATGFVLFLQFSFTLEPYGLKAYVPRIIALTTLRELGPVFTSIILAGRVGATIAAEVGSMKVTQQIDALRVLGTSPIQRIVIPRVLGCLIGVPFLTLFLCSMVYISSGLSAFHIYDMSFETYTNLYFREVFFSDFLSGFVKTFVFGYIIGIVACYYSLSASHKEEATSIGGVTTKAVVSSSVLIIFVDLILTAIFILFN